ncbi:MAG: hypothetical protein GTN49_04770 [candidate division Zixibacteria bacterium]|nr:hypothetical protein [candidate division Zixibacteria bacterium]
MAAVDGVYWALALAIVIIAAALTWLIVRWAGTVGRINQILTDVRKEVPATSASVRKTAENVEQVTSDVADTTSVMKEGASAARLLVGRVREAVGFLDENIFSKLTVLAPLLVAVGGWLARFVASKRGLSPSTVDKNEKTKEEETD